MLTKMLANIMPAHCFTELSLFFNASFNNAPSALSHNVCNSARALCAAFSSSLAVLSHVSKNQA
jgi:hypothetical protein